jgi:hypothetical protein
MGRRLPLAALALVALAAGCGGGSKGNGEAAKSAAQIYADAKSAASAAKGVHIHGSFVDSGQRVTLDLHVAQDKGKGTLSQNAASADIARVGDTAYLRANTAFWQKFGNAGAATLLHDKWLKGKADTQPLQAFAKYMDLDALSQDAFGDPGALRKEGEKTYAGRKVVVVRDTKNEETLYVAEEGKPYPVAVVGDGTISFDSWDETVSVDVPENAVDLSSLLGG